MALVSLLYISESKLTDGDPAGEVGRIVRTAHALNPTAGITGALVFTGTHFAQVIEGDRSAVDRLMTSIASDKRHSEVHIVARDSIAVRRFPDWSMAYHGPSQFVSRHVTQLLSIPSLSGRSRAADWLEELLLEFSRSRGAAA